MLFTTFAVVLTVKRVLRGPAGHWFVGTPYGEETPPRPYGPPLLRALATLVEGGSADGGAALWFR